jgi:hypothetical protein
LRAVVVEIDDVTDAKSFSRFVHAFRKELSDPEKSEEWENVDLPSFLEAMEAWSADSGSTATDANPWRHAADLLSAAKIYE